MPFTDPWSVRTDALAIAREACPDGDGTQMGEEPFETVTEHRQSDNAKRRQRPGSTEKPYSSCGDLGHHTLERLLMQHLPHPTAAELAEAYRTINHGAHYTPGLNINRIYTSPAFVHHRKGGAWEAQAGDIVLIGDENYEMHLLVVEYPPDMEQQQVVSRDYGQFWAREGKSALPGGRQRTRALTRGADGRLWLGSGAPGTLQGPRPLTGYLDTYEWLARVLRAELALVRVRRPALVQQLAH